VPTDSDHQGSGVLGQWQVWTPYAAGLFSLIYGLLGLFWALGGLGFPFGPSNDPSAALTPFPGVTSEVGGPIIAVVGLLGGLVGLAMARGIGGGIVPAVLVGFAWAVAVALIVVVPDYRPLLGLAYAPIILVGAPFDWPPDVGLLDVLPWPVVNQLMCIGGGVLWAAAGLAYWRRTRGACASCGRTERITGWTSSEAARRWGAWTTAVAITIPLLYAATRYLWALGIPLGISEEFLREGQAIGLWWAGAALATLAVGGAALTFGLIRRWGEIFPRWIPFLAGRRVPESLVVIPASLIAVLVTSAGMMFVRLVLTGTMSEVFVFAEEVGWAALAPELLWPVWGVALAAATLAYHYRRRGRCRRCGRL
jgi:hypothetical protein